MKKLIVTIMMLVLVSTSAFGESLDSNYLDLIFDKFASMSESDKKTNQVFLESFISTNTGLEVLYKEALKKEAAMKAYDISKSDVRRNIDALKEWSVEDRISLVRAGASGDKKTVTKLNEKYDSIETEVKNVETETSISETVAQKTSFISKELPVIDALIGKSFRDTETHWASDYVTYLVERGIISGKDTFRFDPEASISKAEIVTLVTKLIIEDPLSVPTYTGSIADITDGKWYDGHMQRGQVLGLIQENDNNLLEPLHNASREEVVKILINAIDVMGIKVSDDLKSYKSNFKDFELVQEDNKEAMTIAINIGLLSGKGDGILDPNSEIKRSEIAVVIKKLYLFILENMPDMI